MVWCLLNYKIFLSFFFFFCFFELQRHNTKLFPSVQTAKSTKENGEQKRNENERENKFKKKLYLSETNLKEKNSFKKAIKTIKLSTAKYAAKFRWSL